DSVTSKAYEAEIVAGLATISTRELEQRVAGVTGIMPGYPRDDSVRFSYMGEIDALLKLRTAQAVYRVLAFPIPRPKALLGDQNFKLLAAAIAEIMAAHPPGTFHTLGIAAAGAQSGVMQRIKVSLAERAGLIPADDRGDLLIRIRPDTDRTGWECLLRISPRPLATRPWRVRDLEGALNATVARAMNMMTDASADDVYVNLGCGSGSLLIERLYRPRARIMLGVDHDQIALSACAANLQAAGSSRPRIDLVRGDVTRLSLPANFATVLTADLPFGQRVSSHPENERMYPLLLDEATRISVPGARFVLITHEIRLMERLLASRRDWRLDIELRITLRGLHPRIYRLVRADG
ncbi:MAG: RNA methyltransferase, partial [Anaerolineae bacterium]|nr:RNA methyltransferase [Anaerolineae bacterium]